jgi:hypothetical protein
MMFFHIDEAGNTGNNLFDSDQPRFSYGVISSVLNVDTLCIGIHRQILKEINDTQIHANLLGFKGLVKIAPLLIKIHKKIQFEFDYYFIEKKTLALVLFFDSVFDAGLNKAVRWDIYWTPIRYLIIEKLSTLFDESLLQDSWRLCKEKRIDKHEREIIQLLSEVKRRATLSNLEPIFIRIIIDALDFGISNPLEIDFGNSNKKATAPNTIAFQFVVSCIARRARKKKRKNISSIIVDRQSEFNDSQIETHDNICRVAEGLKKSSHEDRAYYINHPLHATIPEADILHKGLPKQEITISKSADSIGLQIVDVYLWLANKILDDIAIPPELNDLWLSFSRRSTIDSISAKGMRERYDRFEEGLPKF